MGRPNGVVNVNGSPATHSIVLTEGDRINTGTKSSAVLLLPGRMITLGAGSTVVYKNGSVVPSAGAAKITTANCQGSSCTTSSALLGSGEVKSACDDNGKGDDQGNGDDKGKGDDKCRPKKKCISPKKDKDKDKDCDEDDDHRGH